MYNTIDRAGQNGSSKVRYAVVGLGWIAQQAVLPAFKGAAENSELVALVSDDATKLSELGDLYQIDQRYPYAAYDELLHSGTIDAVFIALPNALHREYTVKAAEAGIHILCEKPIANTSEDARAMIEAARTANVQLMIAYRLHFEEANLTAIEIAHSGDLGGLRAYNAMNTMNVKTGNVRLDEDLSGGSLEDVGIYCINAARYLFRAEPVEVVAMASSTDNPRFDEVDETISVVMRFPEDRLASFICSFGIANQSFYQVLGTKGDLLVKPGFGFDGDLVHMLTIDGKSQERTFHKRDQFAAELLHFSRCVLTGEPVEPSGDEGLADILIIEAIHQSIQTRQPVALTLPVRSYRPSLDREIRVHAVRAPELVNAEPPKA